MRLSKANTLRVLYFLFSSCTAAWLPLLADYCKSRGLSGTEIGFILSINPVMMFVVQPLVGMMSDRLGYKKTLLVSSFLASISYIGFLYYDTIFGWLIFVMAFMSLFYNGIQPVLDSLSLQLSRSDKRFSYGSLRIAGAAGWAFTGIIAGQVIDAIDIRVIFIVSAVTMFLFFLFCCLLTIEKHHEEEVLERNPFRYAGTVLRNRQLVFLLVCIFLVSTSGTSIWNFYSLYMKENGASASLVGFGLSFQGLCELPLFYFSAAIIARLGLKRTLILTVIATALRLVLYSIVKNPIAAIPIELLHGVSWSLFWVACVESVSKMVDNRWMATGQSLLYASYYGAGAIAGSYWTGFLYENKMRIADIFLLNSGLVCFVALLLTRIRSNAKQQPC